ncbi:MAG TPA: histidine phosphatase family protein [Candidatus Binatia bacterium]|nr:histidine phosphatase family protein [Candidatus Binatia bacterium]
MVIFVLRHGETKWNVEKRIQGKRGSHLNKRGRQQAKHAAKSLRKYAVDLIIASPTVRTMQTARIINEPHQVPIIKDAGFMERDQGVLEGLTARGILKIIPDIAHQQKKLGIDWRPPKGETFREVHARAVKNFSRIAKAHVGENVIVVSHGAFIRTLAHHLHGGTPETVFDRKAPDNAELFEVECKLRGKNVLCRLVGRRRWISLEF